MPSTDTDPLDWVRLNRVVPVLRLVPAELRAAAKSLIVDRGVVLHRIGDRVQRVFCVVTGELCLVRRDAHGREVILQRSRGDFFAEASLNSRTYHCDVTVADKGTLLTFPASAFRSSLERNKGFRDAWLAHLAGEIRALRAQCERMNLRSAQDRVRHYIETEGRDGQIALKQTRKAWAAELGLSHEALYRTISRMKSDGTLVSDGRCLRLAG